MGDPRVGKTSLINRKIDNSFEETTTTTCEGVRYYNIEIEGNDVTLEIWDTPGEHKYQDHMPQFFQKVDIVILVYDITNQQSFRSIKERIRNLKRDCGKPLEKMMIYIVGNKDDLNNQREVSYEVALRFSERYKTTLLETSAKTGSDVDHLFKSIALKAYSYFKSPKPTCPIS